jgi:hypothetical protein
MSSAGEIYVRHAVSATKWLGLKKIAVVGDNTQSMNP